MSIHRDNLIAIFLMASITYLIRITGVWTIQRMGSIQKIKDSISFLPGSVLISIVSPLLLQKDPPVLAGAIATLFASIAFNSLLASLLCGVGTVLLVRNCIPI